MEITSPSLLAYWNSMYNAIMEHLLDVSGCSRPPLGASRGFAFVEFSTLPEAVRWMEAKQVATRRKFNTKYSSSKQSDRKNRLRFIRYCR